MINIQEQLEKIRQLKKQLQEFEGDDDSRNVILQSLDNEYHSFINHPDFLEFMQNELRLITKIKHYVRRILSAIRNLYNGFTGFASNIIGRLRRQH